ncbi:hypothetical protein JB92DRAFT_3101235 [Gautieria morchelliformis]|nr:hypothetical protein JB92DRAFT_3101235 [Gautieria morchelliformis]
MYGNSTTSIIIDLRTMECVVERISFKSKHMYGYITVSTVTYLNSTICWLLERSGIRVRWSYGGHTNIRDHRGKKYKLELIFGASALDAYFKFRSFLQWIDTHRAPLGLRDIVS